MTYNALCSNYLGMSHKGVYARLTPVFSGFTEPVRPPYPEGEGSL